MSDDIDLGYSTAQRCPTCDQRAVLTEARADRMTGVSSGRLEAFVCLDGLGWHVWNPDFERPWDRSRP